MIYAKTACTTVNFKFQAHRPLANVQNNPIMGDTYCYDLLLSTPLLKNMKKLEYGSTVYGKQPDVNNIL